jgi:hypothetical protein
MKDDAALSALLGELAKTQSVLARIERYYDEYRRASLNTEAPSTENRIVIAEILANYYTCLETAFLRISQLFENELPPDRWHNDLLDKMTLSIEGVRPQVLSEESYSALRELMRFRHFKRYYLEFEYDWDKLQFLMKKLDDVRPRVNADLDGFEEALRSVRE